MDVKAFLFAVAMSTFLTSSSAIWVFLEPRFDAEFISRNSEMVGQEVYSQFPSGSEGPAQLLSQGYQPVELTRIPIRKRNSEILNTIIGLPNKLRQRG
ncbi:hypothetical protein BV898_08239 [Hypsibius exemplaris]|uniref:Uncharacterized protein n=2 Tax=Hypsibius TaxID=58670 RepID=A0A1W0WQY8_HYPEX|nr:pigment-dispersing factor 2 precursor [Hypsibius dujardini]OQV17614.1 hypothetical protein BV898_08239 [Hypsibius exemplaris]